MPYYATDTGTSYFFLNLLYDLYYLSGSQNTVINSIIDWCFTGEMDIVKRKIEGFISETGQEPLTYQEKVDFIGRLEALGPRWVEYLEMTRQLSMQYKVSGNAWLVETVEVVAGVKKVFFEVIDSRNVMILATEPGEPKIAIVSEYWDRLIKYGNDFKYDAIGIYPHYTGNKTIHQVANFTDRKNWYGRPKSMGTISWQYSEWLLADLMNKTVGVEVVSKHLFAFQDVDPNTMSSTDGEVPLPPDNRTPQEIAMGYAAPTGRPQKTGFQLMVQELQAITTASGSKEKVQGIGAIKYPHGTNAPTKYDLEVMRDTAYLKAVSEMSSGYIYAAHNWAKEITGFGQVKNGIGSNILKDLMELKYTSVVQPEQEFWSSFWQQRWSDLFGENIEYAIKFPNLMENINWNDRDTIDNGGGEDIDESRSTLSDV